MHLSVELLADMTENSVIVETGGIGYEIYMTGEGPFPASHGRGSKDPYLFSGKRGCHAAVWIPSKRMTCRCLNCCWE